MAATRLSTWPTLIRTILIICGLFSDFILMRQNLGRGRKNYVSAKDEFFLWWLWLPKWRAVGFYSTNLWKKGPVFEIFVRGIRVFTFEPAVDSSSEQFRVEMLRHDGTWFGYYSYATYTSNFHLPFSRHLDLVVLCRNRKYILEVSISFMYYWMDPL